MLFKTAGVLIWTAVLCGLVGCGGGLPDPESIDTHEEGAEATVQAMEQLADVLEGVQTVEDAESASVQIEAITQTLKAIAARLKELPPPSDAEVQAISAELEPRLKALGERVQSASERITQNREVAAVLQDAMWDLSFSRFDFKIETQEGIAQREARDADHEQWQRAIEQRHAAEQGRHERPAGIGQQGAGSGTFEPTPGAHPALASLQRQFGPHRVVQVHIIDLPTTARLSQLVHELRRSMQGTRVLPNYTGGNQAYLYAAPVDDLRAFANKITFGTIDQIDNVNRVITVRYQP